MYITEPATLTNHSLNWPSIFLPPCKNNKVTFKKIILAGMNPLKLNKIPLQHALIYYNCKRDIKIYIYRWRKMKILINIFYLKITKKKKKKRKFIYILQNESSMDVTNIIYIHGGKVGNRYICSLLGGPSLMGVLKKKKKKERRPPEVKKSITK